MIPAIERFLSKLNVVKSGCWEWTSPLTTDGYGRIKTREGSIGAHRFIYKYYYGQLQHQVDHLCRNRKCVNPKHLEGVTLVENVKRGLTGKINHHNAKKTHCSHGHEYSHENTYYKKNGWRVCKICSKFYSRNQYLKR